MLSFHAPYRCGRCKHKFKALIDVYIHRDAIAAREPPVLSCPECGAEARFEGSKEAFAAQASRMAAPSASDGDRQTPREAFDPTQPQLSRHVDGETTRLVLVGEMTTGVRWRSAMDDLNHSLVVDLTRVSVVSAGGISPLVTALRAAAPSVREVLVIGCPLPLADALRVNPIANSRINSIVVDADCPSCGAPRRAVVDLGGKSVDEILTREVSCPQCGTGLTKTRPVEAVTQRNLPLNIILGLSGLLAFVGMAVVAIGIVMAGLGNVEARTDGDMPSNGTQGVERLEMGADRVIALGHGGPYPTASEAEAAARDKAIGAILSAMNRAIAEARGTAAGTGESSASAVAKFVGALGLDPEQMVVASDIREADDGFEVDAKYGMDRSKFDAIVADFSKERQWGGMKLVRPFPPSTGLRVIRSDVDGIDPGTRLLRVGELSIERLDELPDAASGASVVVQDPGGEEQTIVLP